MKHTRILATSIAALLFAGAGYSPSASAATVTWDGEFNAGSMVNATNWVGDVTPAAGDSLVFTGQFTTGAVNDFAPDTLFNGIIFNRGAGNFTLSGSVIDLGGNIVDDSLIAQTISAPLALTATRTANVSSRFGALTISGVISEINGTGFGLIKSGAGLLTLTGSNSFTGPVTISGGTLSIATDSNSGFNPLGSGTPGSRLNLDGSALRVTAATSLSSDRGIFLGNAGIGTGGTVDVSSAGLVTYNGIIANNGGTNSLTKTGLGTLVLGAVNSFTGSTIVNHGTLRLDFNQFLGTTANIINPVSNLVLGGVASELGNAGAGGPTTSTAGSVLNMTGSSTGNSTQTFNGVTLNAGAVTIQTTLSGGGGNLLTLGALTRNPGSIATFSFDGTLTPGVNAITTTATNTNGILGGWAAYQAGTAAAITSYAAVDGTGNIVPYTAFTNISTGSTITSAAVANYQVTDTNLNVALNTTDAVTTDIHTLSLASTVNGVTGNPPVGGAATVTVGTPGIGSTGILRVGAKGGFLTASGAGSSMQTTNNSQGVLTIGNVVGNGILTAGGADNTPGEISFISGNTTVNTNGFIINSVIADNGTGPVSVTYGGTQGSGGSVARVAGTNTYSGGTTLTTGRLNVGNLSAFGTGPVTIRAGAQAFLAAAGLYNNAWNIAGGGTSIASGQPGFYDTPGAVRMGGNSTLAGTITLLNDASINSRNTTNNVISGQITGGYNLILTSSGASGGDIQLGNTANNWTGNLIIDQKRVILLASGVIPNGAGFGNVVLGNNANGILDLNGFNETINGLSSLGASPFVQNNLAATTATLTIGDSDASANFAGTIRDNSGTGGVLALAKIGAGMATLTHVNTYTGGTAIKAGTLFSAVAGAAFGSGPISIGDTTGNANAALQVTNIGQTFANAINVIAGSTGQLSLQTSGSGQNFVFNGPVAMNNALIVKTFAGNTNTLVMGGVLTGASPLTVNANGGMITIAASNPAFSGGVTIGAGTARTGTNNSLGTGNVTVNAGTTLDTNGATAMLLTNLSGGGTVTSNLNPFSSALNLNNTADSTFSGSIFSQGAGVTKTGSGKLTLSGFNSYTGPTTINAGTLSVSGSLDDFNAVTINGGTYEVATSDTVGAVTLTSGIISGAGILTGSAYALQSGTVSGNLGGTGSALSKTGIGTVTLSGANTYDGPTAIDGGVLRVTGSLANTSMAIGTAGTLAGTGTIGGLVTLSGAGSAINLEDGAIGTLTLSNGLTLNPGNVLSFDLGATGDRIALTGGAYTFGGAGAANINLLNLAGYGLGTYNLITGATGLSLGNFALSSPTLGGFNLALGVAGGNTLTLTVSPSSGPAVAFWRGDVNAVWNTNNAGNTNWATTAAGTTDTGAIPDGTTAVTFAATGATNTASTTLGANQSIKTLTVTTSSAVGIGGANKLTVTDAGGIIVNAGAGALSITANEVALGISQTWTNNSSNPMTVSSVISGANGLTVAGSGVVVLSGNNTFSGGTTLSTGATLNVNSNAALGTGVFTINGGTLDNTRGAAGTLATNNPQNWNGDFIFVGTNALDLGTGAVVLNANRTVTVSASTLTVGGVISGPAFGLTKAGAGTLVLNGANTFSGGVAISGGTLRAGNSSALGVGNVLTFGGATGVKLQVNGQTLTIGGLNGGATATIENANAASGVLTVNNSSNGNFAGTLQNGVGAGTLTLTKDGSGTLTLSGSNTHSGGTTIVAGQLNMGSNTALGTGPLTLNGGAFDNTTGADLTLPANNSQNWGGNFTFAGTNGLNLGTGTVTLSANSVVTVVDKILTVAGAIVGDFFNVAKAGAGTLELTGANTYTGATDVRNGILQLTGSLSPSTTLNLGLGSTGGRLVIGGLSQTVAGLTTTGTAGAANVVAAGNPVGSTLTVDLPFGTNTFAGSLGGGDFITNNLSLVKNGSGTLVLAGASTFFGGTTVNAGTLQINNLGALGTGFTTIASSAALNVNIGGNILTSAIGGAGSINITPNAETRLRGDLSTFTGTINISANGAAKTDIDGSAVNLNAAATINIPSGTLFVANNAGAVVVPASIFVQGTGNNENFGALRVDNNGTISGPVTLTGETSLGAQGSIGTISGNIGDGGFGFGITKVGTGTLILAGANTFSGNTSVNLGTLSLGNPLALQNSTLINGGVVFNASVFDHKFTIAGLSTGVGLNLQDTAATPVELSVGNNGVSSFYLGSLSGAGSLRKIGSGTLTLGGFDTHTGGTTVDAGTLLVSGSLSGSTTVAGGTLGGTGNVGAVTVNANANLLGGDGLAASGAFSIGGDLSLLDGSRIQLALGLAGAHSSLTRTGGAWSFDFDQAFSFVDFGAGPGFYDNIVTGLAANPGTLATWKIINNGWSGTFTFDGTNVDLNLATIPEPGSGLSLFAGLGLLGMRRWRRRRF